MVRPELDPSIVTLIKLIASNDIFHLIITWTTGKELAKLTFKPYMQKIYRFNKVLKYVNSHMDNNEITILNLNNMLTENSKKFLFSKTKQRHFYFCSSLAKIKKRTYENPKFQLLGNPSKEIQSQQRKLIREAKLYSYNLSKENLSERLNYILDNCGILPIIPPKEAGLTELTNGFSKVENNLQRNIDKTPKKARPSYKVFIKRDSIIQRLSLNEEDFKLNKYDLANAWPRLTKLSSDEHSPSAACIKLLNFDSRTKISQFIIKRSTLQWKDLSVGKMIFIPKGKIRTINQVQHIRPIPLSN
ncbi:hypothetical protein GJ496_003290 [Pomphorhynchus laevis]|nr:hypothetical protein GJ496_003290 [Pomphorhynchus laevis]